MGAIYGLYGAFAIGIVAALFGGTVAQISGPINLLTVITALVVVYAMDEFGDLDAGLGFLVACFLAAGAIQVLMGVFRLGAFIRYIPYPVLFRIHEWYWCNHHNPFRFFCICRGEFNGNVTVIKNHRTSLREQNQPS